MAGGAALSIYLVPDAPQLGTRLCRAQGVLRIKWGTTELTTNWRIDQDRERYPIGQFTRVPALPASEARRVYRPACVCAP